MYMAKENIVNKWQEIDFETLKNRLTSIEDNSILIDIKSMVKTSITIENFQIIINKLHLIISNDEDSEVEIDIDPKPKTFERNKMSFKFDYSYGTEIVLNFYK